MATKNPLASFPIPANLHEFRTTLAKALESFPSLAEPIGDLGDEGAGCVGPVMTVWYEISGDADLDRSTVSRFWGEVRDMVHDMLIDCVNEHNHSYNYGPGCAPEKLDHTRVLAALGFGSF